MNRVEQSLVELGRGLQRRGYEFTAITPFSHAQVVQRAQKKTSGLRDIFGWNLEFKPADLDPELFSFLRTGDALERVGENGAELYRSRIRAATLDGRLYLHSAYPTEAADSVFFGPDTYRFARLIQAEVVKDFGRGIDLGCGSGAGGLCVRRFCREELVLSDVNELALLYARVNAQVSSLSQSRPQSPETSPEMSPKISKDPSDEKLVFLRSDLFAQIQGQFDLILANPPFMIDPNARAYRDGGGSDGLGLSKRIIDESLPRLAPGGRLLLYSGSPIREGHDSLHDYAVNKLRRSGPDFALKYGEIDPDIFGEELSNQAYAGIERIAAIGMVVERA